jgi:hypothetical protein
MARLTKVRTATAAATRRVVWLPKFSTGQIHGPRPCLRRLDSFQIHERDQQQSQDEQPRESHEADESGVGILDESHAPRRRSRQ